MLHWLETRTELQREEAVGVLCIEQIRPTTIVCRDGGTSVLAQVIREIQGIEGIRMTIEIEVIEVIVINDARASETFVKMGRPPQTRGVRIVKTRWQ